MIVYSYFLDGRRSKGGLAQDHQGDFRGRAVDEIGEFFHDTSTETLEFLGWRGPARRSKTNQQYATVTAAGHARSDNSAGHGVLRTLAAIRAKSSKTSPLNTAASKPPAPLAVLQGASQKAVSRDRHAAES